VIEIRVGFAVDLDDDVAASDGRRGVVIGLDPDKGVIAFVDALDPSVVYRVALAEIAVVVPFAG
jgi:hypothetical protein